MAAHPDMTTAHTPARGASSGKATASLVLGILGLVMAVLFWPLGLVLSAVGLIVSLMARGEIRRNGGASNAGLATAGMVCSIIGLVLSLLILALVGAVIASN